jgi:hypothetical protein
MMPRHTRLALAAALVLAADGSTARVLNERQPGGKPLSGGIEILPDKPVRLQCWQHGVRIIDERGLTTPALNLPGEFNALSFSRPGAGRSVILVTLSKNACLITEED